MPAKPQRKRPQWAGTLAPETIEGIRRMVAEIAGTTSQGRAVDRAIAEFWERRDKAASKGRP